MKAFTANSEDTLTLLIADQVRCDTLTMVEAEEILLMLRQCARDGSYDSLGRHCARALLADVRGQLLSLKHIGIAKGQQ